MKICCVLFGVLCKLIVTKFDTILNTSHKVYKSSLILPKCQVLLLP